MKMKFFKKSQIEIGINWIFVLIAGSIIVLFFLSLAFAQKRISDVEISRLSSDTIYRSMNTALLSDTYYNEIKRLGNFQWETICIGNFSGYYFNKVQKEVPFIFFAPSKSNGGDLYIWSLKWKNSYPLTNIVYLLFSNNKIIIKRSGFLEEFCKNISRYFHSSGNVVCVNEIDDQLVLNLNRENILTMVVVTDLSDTLTFNDLKGKFRNIKEKDLMLLKVGGTMNEGNITFISNRNSETYNYVERTELIGAIVSADVDFYRCMIQRRMLLNSFVAEIYRKKSSELSKLGGTCQAIYLSLNNTFNTIIAMEKTGEYLTDDSARREYLNNIRDQMNSLLSNLGTYECELII